MYLRTDTKLIGDISGLHNKIDKVKAISGCLFASCAYASHSIFIIKNVSDSLRLKFSINGYRVYSFECFGIK